MKRVFGLAVALALCGGCVGVSARDMRRPGARDPAVWAAPALALAAASEDMTHEEVDTAALDEAVARPPEVAPAAPARARPIGVHLGLQTFIDRGRLDADSSSPEVLVGVSYRLNPGGKKLAYEFGLDFAGTQLSDYSTAVEADSTLTVLRGQVLYELKALKSGAYQTSTYVAGGLAMVTETARYENVDGTHLVDYQNGTTALSVGVGQMLFGGRADFRYDIDFALGAGSQVSYHYLTLGCRF